MKKQFKLVLILLFSASLNLSLRCADTIKINATEALDEINFWAKQLSEHALFLYLGLEDKTFKADALNLRNLFEEYRKSLGNDNSISNLNKIMPLINKLKTFKQNLLSAQNSKWIGWSYPALIQHMLDELNYFQQKLNGKQFTLQEEIDFWNKERAEEAAVTAHLLDPSQKQLVKEGLNLSDEIEKKPISNEQKEMLYLSLKLYAKLDDFGKRVNPKMVKSVIHPLLATHIANEGKRAEDTLNKFKEE